MKSYWPALLGLLSGASAPALNYLGYVATRTFIPNIKSGSSNYANSRTAHVSTQAMTNAPQLIFPGWYDLNGIDTASVGLTYTASIEYPAGTFTQVTWSAATSVAVAAALANTPPSDAGIPLAVAIPSAGITFWVRNFCKVTSGSGGGLCVTQATTSTRWVAAGEALASSGTVIGDQTMSGTVTDGGTGTFIYPLAIIAQTTLPSFGLVGDSRTIGTTSSGTTPDANGNMGQVARSIGAQGYAFMNGGVGGSYLRDWNRSGSMRLGLLQYCSHVINGYGINDLRTGGLARTALQVESDFATFAKKVYNKPIITVTIAPQTTSGNGYVDAAGQTADVLDAQRQTTNAWLLGLPSPFNACVDVAARMQDPGNPSLWKSPGETGDGLHATSTGYDDIVTSNIFNGATLGALTAISRYSVFALSQQAVLFDVGRAGTVNATISGTAPCEGSGYVWSAAVNITYAATGFGAGNGPSLTFVGASNCRLVGDATMNAAFNGVPGITLTALFSLPSLPAATRCLTNISTAAAGTERATLYVSAAGIVTCVYRAADGDAASTLTAPSAITTGVPVLIVANLDPITNTAQLSINGTVVATGTFITSGSNFSATNSGRVGIGTAAVGDSQMSFGLREADFVPVAVTTTAVRQRLEGDMAWRAGVAAQVLPGGHPYVSAAPTSN